MATERAVTQASHPAQIQPRAGDTAYEQGQYHWGNHSFIFISSSGLSYFEDVLGLLEGKGTATPLEKCVLSKT